MNKKVNNYLFMVSAIVILISSALYVIFPMECAYIFSVAAAGYAISKLTFRYEGDNFRLKRLYRIQKFSGFAMLAASYFMFKPYNQWVIFLFIVAVLELYTEIGRAHV